MATFEDAPPAQNLVSLHEEDEIDYSDEPEAPGAEDHRSSADHISSTWTFTTPHPVAVLWENQTHSLFQRNTFTHSFFLEDDTIVDLPLSTLFTACKEILSLETSVSLGIYFTSLCFPDHDPVEIYEEETVCTYITLRQILDLYLQLHLNDDNTNPAPFEIELKRRQNAVAVLQDLKTAANDGVGYMQMESIGSNDEEETGDDNGYDGGDEEYDEEGVVHQQEPFEEQYADAEEVDSHGDQGDTVGIDNVHGEAQTLGNEAANTVADESLQDSTRVYGDEAATDYNNDFDETSHGGDENPMGVIDETFEDEEAHGYNGEAVGIDDPHDQLGENSEETATATLDPTYEETGHEGGDNDQAAFEGPLAEPDDGEVAHAEFDDTFDQPEQHGDDVAAASFEDTYEEARQTGAEDPAPGFDETVEELGQNIADNVTAGAHDNYGEPGLNEGEHPIAEYEDTYNDSEQDVHENFSVGHDENSYLEPVQDDNVNATAGFNDAYLESGLGFDDAPATESGVAHDEPYDEKSQSATVQGEDALVEHALSETHNEESTGLEGETADYSDDQIDNLLGNDTQHENVQVEVFQSDAAHNGVSPAADLDAALASVQDQKGGNDNLILDLELDFEDAQANSAPFNNTARPLETTSYADDEDLIDYSDDEDIPAVETPAASTTESQGVKRSHDLDDDGLDDPLDIKRPKFDNGSDYASDSDSAMSLDSTSYETSVHGEFK